MGAANGFVEGLRPRGSASHVCAPSTSYAQHAPSRPQTTLLSGCGGYIPARMKQGQPFMGQALVARRSIATQGRGAGAAQAAETDVPAAAANPDASRTTSSSLSIDHSGKNSSSSSQSLAVVAAAAAAAATPPTPPSVVEQAGRPPAPPQHEPIAAASPSYEPLEQPPEAGVVWDDVIDRLGASDGPQGGSSSGSGSKKKGSVSSPPRSSGTRRAVGVAGAIPPEESSQVKESWNALMRWSRRLRRKDGEGSVLDRTEKVVVFGGGSFGTAMAAALARQKPSMAVTLLLRDPYVCQDINRTHRNSKYLQEFELPASVTATTSAAEAISGAQYAVHAVPVQHTRAFLQSVRELLPPTVPIISVSKGLELGSGLMMHELIPSALGRRQPTAFLSGPSFAREVMAGSPTGLVAAAKDPALAREVQQLFASPSMRVNLSTDVVGVEICGALKNVLAIAAGIVEGLQLGNNAMAALVAQGCAEIRWLAEKMGAKPTTVSGLSGLGDIMLTCYGSLSRNRSVGIRLGSGESLADILAASSQIAEGVATAGVVVTLARKYKVSLPVLTAVAQVLDAGISPREAVEQIMELPQIEER